MNCPRCQASVTPQDKYCPTCGLALEAAKKGGAKRPPRREYEEASTQLVDVDEFRKYMAREGAEGAESDAALPGSTNLAGAGSKPVQNLAGPTGIGTEPLPPEVKTPGNAPAGGAGAGKGGAKAASAEDLPEIKRPMGPKIILGLLVLGIIALIVYFAFGASGG